MKLPARLGWRLTTSVSSKRLLNARNRSRPSAGLQPSLVNRLIWTPCYRRLHVNWDNSPMSRRSLYSLDSRMSRTSSKNNAQRATHPNMNQSNIPHSDLNAVNERLAKTFYSHERYTPIFLAVTGAGLIAIFLLTQFGILGESAPQLLYIGGVTLLFSIAELPLLALAQRNQGIAAYLLGSALIGTFAILLTLFWQGIVVITVLIALSTPLTSLRNGIPRKYFPALLLLLVVIISSIFYINANPPLPRLQSSTAGAIASIVFLSATGLLLFTI